MKNFLRCGVFGWCLEIFWTSLDSLRRGELKLMGQSSAWMFPIYGMAALIRPLSVLFHGLICLDYTPLWFLTELFYEKVLERS